MRRKAQLGQPSAMEQAAEDADDVAVAMARLADEGDGWVPLEELAPANIVLINRAPVLTLWATLVAERMGFDHEAALTLGKAVAGLNAQSKGRSLGIYGPPKPGEGGGQPKRKGLGEDYWVTVCGRPVPVKDTPQGTRAVVLDQSIDPASVEKYLASKFGDDFDRVREALRALTEALSPEDLAEMAYDLYERFRPQIPKGKKGWGQAGELDLGLVREMAKEARG